jgi:7-cyano-7-deazaguanine synthase in queuosine biosynthesis
VVDIKEGQALLTKIEDKRKEMIRIGIKYGKSHKNTVECSQELDKLILEYQKLFIN